MATPKGMPEYAKGTASAIAASKKEAELTKKVQATPLAKAPAPAISNAMATANSNINKYDVTKANQNAFNAAQKATIAKQVEKQAPTPSVETFKKAMPAPTGMPVQATGDVKAIQNYATSNIAPMTEQEKKDAFIQAVQKRMEVEKDLMGERVVPPSTTALQNRAIESVNQNLQTAQERITGSTPLPQTFPVVPPMPLTAQTDLGTTATKEVTSTTPPSEKAPYVALGEETKTATTTTPTPTTKEKIITGTAQDKAQNYADGFAREDGYVWNATVGQWESPDIWQNTLKNREAFKAVVAPTTEAVTPTPTPTSQVEKGTPTEAEKVPDGFKDERGYTWNDVAGQWESPDVWANTVANRKKMELPAPTVDQGLVDLQKEIAGTDALEQQFRNVSREQEPMVRTQPFGEPVVEEQPPQFDNYPSQYARAVVDKQIADANRQIDLQIAEATRNRDLQTAQNLQAYKRAINDMRDKGFMQNQQLMQQMANRGMLTSGIAADAQTRLQMSMNQNIRDIAVKNQASQDKINADFKTAFDKLAQKRQDLETNREGDVEKIVKGIQADNREIAKLDVDLRKLQLEENKTLLSNAQDVLKRYADQGYDTSMFEPYMLAGNVQGLARAMSQSGNRELSLLGEDMASKIDETNSQIILNKRNAERAAMETKQALSQIDKQRSESTGFVYQNGVPLKDAKGNYMMTEEAEQFIKKLQAQADEVRQSNAVKTAALNWEKIVDVGKMDIAERKLKQDEAQFISRMNQDYTIALNKLTSQDARDALANRIEFGKSLLNSANAELSNLINTKANKKKITDAMARQYAAKQLLGNEVGVPYRDDVMEALLSEK